MKHFGLVVIAVAAAVAGYFLLSPSGEQAIEPTPPRPSSSTPPPPAASESTDIRASAPEPAPAPTAAAPQRPTTETALPDTPPTNSSGAAPPNLFRQFEAQPVDPQWSQDNEISLETYLFANENYSELEVERIQCKSSLCEIRAYEKANTVWARVIHDLAEDQGWNLSSWRYADYYDKDGRRLIRTVVGRKAE